MKINFSFVPGAYITERSHGHRGIKGLEMMYTDLWKWGYWLPGMLVLVKGQKVPSEGCLDAGTLLNCALPATPLPSQVSTVPCCAWCSGRGSKDGLLNGVLCTDSVPEPCLNPWGLNAGCSLTHLLEEGRGNRATPRESRWWAMSHDARVSWTWAVFKCKKRPYSRAIES